MNTEEKQKILTLSPIPLNGSLKSVIFNLIETTIRQYLGTIYMLRHYFSRLN